MITGIYFCILGNLNGIEWVSYALKKFWKLKTVLTRSPLYNTMNYTTNNVIQIIKNKYQEIVPNLIFCFIFGSSVYDPSRKGDIDIVIVTAKKLRKNQIQKLESAYFDIHRIFRRLPSIDFPGEKVTITNLINAENGKGFYYDYNQNRISFSFIVKNIEWNDFNSHRLYLAAMAGPSIFIFGNRYKYKAHREKALFTIVILALINGGAEYFTIENLADLIIGEGKKYLGFSKCKQMKSYLIEALNKIEKKYFVLVGDNYYKLNNIHYFLEIIDKIKKFNKNLL